MELALGLDAKNGNTLWVDVIFKVIKNVRVAFKVLPDGTSVFIGRNNVQCHITFDIKIEDFGCKVRLVTRSHMTEAPATIMYASVVSRKMVRIALKLAALNDLEVKLSDILNAHVQAHVAIKVWTT